MSKGMPNESSVYAREGSAAHEIGEMVLCSRLAELELAGKAKTNAIDLLGHVVPDYPEVEVDESMCAAVQEYIDAVWAEIDAYEAEGHTDWQLQVEEKFDLTHIYPDMFGTCDAVLFLPAWKKLMVFDYKHGWVSVPVEKNKQTMYYALGAITGKHNREVDEIELVIVQPRSGRHTIVKRWPCDMEELLDFKYVLIDSAKRTEPANAKLNPGEWCKFCTAAPVCRALSNKVMEIIMAVSDPIDGVSMPNPDKIPLEELREIWGHAPMIEGWIKNVKAYAHQLAVKENKFLPRTKLVEGRSNRAWIDEEEAKKELVSLQAIGELEGDIYITKLKSPKQIEDMLPKKVQNIIGKMWKKGRGALTLVPDTDDRESVRIDALKEFDL